MSRPTILVHAVKEFTNPKLRLGYSLCGWKDVFATDVASNVDCKNCQKILRAENFPGKLEKK